MKSFKRLLSLCLCLVLVLVLCPTSRAEVAADDPLKYLSYEITNGTVTITGYYGSLDHLIIPDTIEGLPVTKIGKMAFYECKPYSSITIPASVTYIGDLALGGPRNVMDYLDIYFLGDRPDFHRFALGNYLSYELSYTYGDDGLEITAYYPIHNSTWTDNTPGRCGAYMVWWTARHDRDEGTLTTPATCTTWGNYQYTCMTCGKIETEYIQPLGHSWDEGTLITPSTCTTKGSHLHTCTVCGETDIDPEPALGHSWDEGTLVTAPTCTAVGRRLYTCTVCGDTKTTTVSPLYHSWDEGTVVSLPTCTEPGLIDYTCKTCGDVIRKETPDATGHQFQRGVWVTQPGCETTGQKSYTCSTCGFIKYATFAANGHSLDEGTVISLPTCTEPGQIDYTCKTCGDVIREETPDATGHTEVTDPGFAPTCTSTGLTDGTHCTTCNQVVIPQEVIPIVHSYKTVAVNATCTEDGSITSTCTLCGHISVATIPAPGHSYEAVIVAPTCTEEGTNTSTCTTCGDVIVGTIPATGHQFEDGSCIHCGEPEAVSLPGDVNGDGKVNIMDVAKLYAHIKGTLLIEDETQLRQADLTGDGNVNILDIAKLYTSVKGTE